MKQQALPRSAGHHPRRLRLAGAAMLVAAAVAGVVSGAQSPADAAARADATGAATGPAAKTYDRTTIKPTAALIRGTGEKRATSDGINGRLGVASFNVYKDLTPAESRADLAKISANRAVDLIGFQEAQDLRPFLDGLPATWDYWMTANGTNSREVAVAWRTSRLELVSARARRAHRGLSDLTSQPTANDRPFPGRYTTDALFTVLGTDAQLRLLNAHTNQYTESFHVGDPGVAYRNTNVTGARLHFQALADLVEASQTRYTVVTGDLNWDYVADRIKNPSGFVQHTVGQQAVSSYRSLGLGEMTPTHVESGRYIDYVMLSNDSEAGFLSHTALAGYESDHEPLLAVIALN